MGRLIFCKLWPMSPHRQDWMSQIRGSLVLLQQLLGIDSTEITAITVQKV